MDPWTKASYCSVFQSLPPHKRQSQQAEVCVCVFSWDYFNIAAAGCEFEMTRKRVSLPFFGLPMLPYACIHSLVWNSEGIEQTDLVTLNSVCNEKAKRQRTLQQLQTGGCLCGSGNVVRSLQAANKRRSELFRSASALRWARGVRGAVDLRAAYVSIHSTTGAFKSFPGALPSLHPFTPQ